MTTEVLKHAPRIVEEPDIIPGRLVEWRKRLADARARGSFTHQDWEEIQCWNTCLVGEKLGFPVSGKEAYDRAGGYGGDLMPLGNLAKANVQRNYFDGFDDLIEEIKAV